MGGEEYTYLLLKFLVGDDPGITSQEGFFLPVTPLSKKTIEKNSKKNVRIQKKEKKKKRKFILFALLQDFATADIKCTIPLLLNLTIK